MTSHHPSIDHLIDYAHHELSPAEDARIFAHLADCPQCRTEYDAEMQLTAALKHAASAQTLEMPSAIKAHVWERVRARESAWRGWLRPLIAVPVGAAIVFGALVAVQTSAPLPQPAVGAQYYFDLHSAAARQENPLTDRSAPVPNIIETSEVSSTPSLPLVEAAHVMSLGDDPGR
jgi:anti-sigma factor (TIGR02949 family)